jgi:ABC-2 type transport system permease protein
MTALYRVLLRQQVTRGRLIGLGLLGLVAVLLGFAVGASEAADPVDDGIQLVNQFGLSLFVPVVTLVFAAAVLGDPNEDGTLVYLWLRPVARWRIALAALAATLTVALPVVVIPMVGAAIATGAGSDLVVATLVSCGLATLAYAGMFTWLGLRVKRALVWGLAYVLIWEGFVATASTNTARLSLRAQTRSLLSRLADGPESLVEVSLGTAIAIPLFAATAGIVLTVRRLARQDVA